MKNSSHPIQTYRKNISTKLSSKENISVSLVPNEFYDYDDPIGFFSNEPEPFRFLSVEDITRSPSNENKHQFFTFNLSDKKRM